MKLFKYLFLLLVLFGEFFSEAQPLSMVAVTRDKATWYRLGQNVDVPTGALGIYGTYRFRSAYTGNALRIRRASDNTTIDVGFVGHVVDATAIKAFNSNNTILTTVNIIYDESGNGYDLTVEGGFNEAILYYDAIIDNYRIRFLPANVGNAIVAASNSSYRNASISVGSQTLSVYHLIQGRNSTINASAAYWEFGNNGSNDILYFTSSPGYNRSMFSSGGQKTGAANYWESSVDFTVHSLRSQASGCVQGVDNIFSTTNAAISNYTSTGFRIGSWSGSGVFGLESDWCGTVIYNSYLSDPNNTQAIQVMQNAVGKTVKHNVLVTIIGDSESVGYGLQKDEGYAYKLVQAYNKPNIRWINASVGGTKITDINTNFTNRVGSYTTAPSFDSGPTVKIALIWAGTNDAKLTTDSGATIYANLQTLVSNCRSAGYTYVIFMDIIRRGDFTAQDITDVAAFNALVAADNTTFDAKVYLSGYTWNTSTTLLSDDVHINNAGTLVVYNALKPVLDAFIP